MENDNGDNCSMTDIGACDEWVGSWGREEGIKLKRMVSRSYQKEKGQTEHVCQGRVQGGAENAQWLEGTRERTSKRV